jgi:hypothetical protein
MESQKKHTPKFRPNPGLTLMDQVREGLRYHHYAYRTEQTYGHWILRSIHYVGGKTHPNRLGAKEVERFLSHLATEGQVSASTQRQGSPTSDLRLGQRAATPRWSPVRCKPW